MRSAGKSALITGAPGGIGLTFVKPHVGEAAKVIIADINTSRERQTSADDLTSMAEFLASVEADYIALQTATWTAGNG